MIDTLKRIFGRRTAEATSDPAGGDHDIRVAACALFVEMGRIDGSFTQNELDTVTAFLQQRYGMQAAHAEDLMAEADRALEESVDDWQFARLINENYTNEEKVQLIELLWRIVYVDGKMDDHENYLMHKLSNLLRLSHDQLIDAKLKVLRDR